MLALFLAISLYCSPRLWVNSTSELNIRVKHVPRPDGRAIHLVMDDGIFLRASTEQLPGDLCARTHLFRWQGPFYTSEYILVVAILDGSGKVLESTKLEIGRPPAAEISIGSADR